ncbi:hypothetical protein CR513_55280, partial [Mucuna pruriens]
MVAKVLISNGFEPGKGLGRKLDGMAEQVALQENTSRSRLGYEGVTRKGRPRRKTQGGNYIPKIGCDDRGSTLRIGGVDIPHGMGVG